MELKGKMSEMAEIGMRVARRDRRRRSATSAWGALALAALAGSAWTGQGFAQDVKLPSTVTMTAYDTGTSGFNISVAVGKMLKEKYQADTRVLPAGNDVARLAPLKGGRAQFSAMGIGMYFAQEGVFEFGAKEWGPQQLHLLLGSNDCNGLAMAVAKDTGVTEMKDLKGKRIAIVVGSPALTQNALALLAFGGLTGADVKLVEFASNAAMFKGMLNNEADAAATSTINPLAREVETSPRGLVWPATAHSDAEGWKRLQKTGPFFAKHVATCGAGLSKEKSIELPAYPYPLMMVYADQTADFSYGLTKALIDGYDQYKDGAPGAAGLSVKTQKLQWAVPYHAGAVKALKEAGVWTAAEDAHNAALLKRQATLKTAWDDYNKGTPPADAAEFRKGWMAARKAALSKAGMDVVFE